MVFSGPLSLVADAGVHLQPEIAAQHGKLNQAAEYSNTSRLGL